MEIKIPIPGDHLETRVENTKSDPKKCEAFGCHEPIIAGQGFRSPYQGHYHSQQCYQRSLED